MNDPSWDSFPTTRRFMELVHSKGVTMNVSSVDVLAIAEGQPVRESDNEVT